MSVLIKKTTFIALLAVVTLSACSEKKTESTTGEKLDKAVEVTKQKATDVKDTTVEAYDATAEKAAELTDEAKAELKEACEAAKEKLGTEDKDC